MTIADFNEKFFEFARKHNIPVTTYSAPKRYGIIPCRRCAFWDKLLDSNLGECRRERPSFVPVHEDYRLEKPTGWWPTTIGDEDGCHKGLLREEAAPLPPEQQETK